LARLSRPDIPLGAPVGSLPIGVQQLIEIARALVSDARVLIFDEPTSSLTEEDTAHLFEVIRDLRDQGLGIVYISHFLEEVAQVCDVYTVLRDGRAVGHGELSRVSLDEMIHLMVGRELSELFPCVPHTAGEPILEIKGLCGAESPRDVDLTLHRGEIVGLAGLIGAGRSELVRRVFGLEEIVSGRVRVIRVGSREGRRVGGAPGNSIRNGLGFVSEDRKEEGLALSMSIVDNLTMTRLAPYGRFGILNLRRRSEAAEEWMKRVKCKAAGANQVIDQLSGGNQQKIAIARLLHQQADVLLLDEPTRGVDVGTKAEIYRLIGELAAQGAGIILVSSYLPELLNVCDRIGVMCRGRLREIRSAADWTEDEIMHSATGRDLTT
jgi:ribose transport system ATP-binding protein